MIKTLSKLIVAASFIILPVATQAAGTVTASDITSDAVTVRWPRTAQASRYRVILTNDDTGRMVRRFTTTRLQKTITDLGQNTNYSIAVRPFTAGQFRNSYTAVAVHTLLDFDLTSPVLSDDFEQTTSGTQYLGYDISYVTGQTGYGFVDVYDLTDEGVELRANILQYDNSTEQLMDPDIGTIEFWVSPTADLLTDGDSHGLLAAESEYQLNQWDITAYANTSGVSTIGVSRDFAPCVRQIVQAPYSFTVGDWYKLTLTWRGTETQFFINDEPVGDFATSAREIFPGYREGIVSVGDDLFATDSLRITQTSPIPVRDLDANLKSLTCPDFSALIADLPVQETYQDIALHNFADAATRAAFKAVMDVLPPAYDGIVEHVVVVDDDTYNDLMIKPSILGNYSFPLRTMFLRASVFASADLVTAHADAIFHEFGHSLTYDENLSYSGPNSGARRTQWANISGIKAYVGECVDPTEVLLEEGFLTAYASTMPDEDLAEWVGIALDLYSKDSTFSALLDPTSDAYSSLYRLKVDYLLEHGFISQTIYNAITATTENSDYYTEFND